MENYKGLKCFFLLLCLLNISTPVFTQMHESGSNDQEILNQKLSTLNNTVAILQKLKFTGFIQTQFQYGEPLADGINFKLAKRANSYESSAYYPGSNDYKGLDGFSRFGIRMGRFKLTYEEGIVTGVFQIDVSEKGINDANVPGRNVVMFKDLYINVKDPWFGTCSFRSGIFDRPFGYEISYSISLMEYIERSRITQLLFPEEKDLGAMLTLQPANNSILNFLKLEAGLFAGNGIKPQIDSRLDFIGHLTAKKNIDKNISISGGVSLYYGSVLQTDSSTYIMKGNKFELESKVRNNIGKLATRRYIGFDVQYKMKTSAGTTQLRGEYIFGKHPGNASGAYNFNLNDIQNGPVYMRNINGGNILLAQDLGRLPVGAIVKYDWYNPNIDVSGNDIAAPGSGTTAGDIKITTLGFGLMWYINSVLKLTSYYNIVTNETTTQIGDIKDGNKIIRYGYEGQRPDNVFTLRLQYKF